MPDENPSSKLPQMEDLHGINITHGVPPEIWVGIGRGDYEDDPEPEYAVAIAVSAWFLAKIKALEAEIEHVRAARRRPAQIASWINKVW